MRIGIDMGGTKIEGIVLSSDGIICAQKRVPTPSGDYQATIKTLVDLVDELSKKVELKKELISLKKTKSQPKRQESLLEEIQKIETYLSKHKIQK